MRVPVESLDYQGARPECHPLPRGTIHLAIITAGLYLLSFATPVTWVDGDRLWGVQVFYLAGLSVFSPMLREFPLLFITFLANPFLWAAFIFFLRGHHPLATGASAVAATLASYWLFASTFSLLGPGYYFWLLAPLILTVAAGRAWHHTARASTSS